MDIDKKDLLEFLYSLVQQAEHGIYKGSFYKIQFNKYKILIMASYINDGIYYLDLEGFFYHDMDDFKRIPKEKLDYYNIWISKCLEDIMRLYEESLPGYSNEYFL